MLPKHGLENYEIEVSKKRPRIPSNEGNQLPKIKIRKMTNKVAEVKRCLATVTSDSDYKRSERNYVALAPNLYHSLFGENAVDGGYLKVENLIIRAYRDFQLSDSQMDVNLVCYNQIEESAHIVNDSVKIWVSQADLSEDSCKPIAKMCLQVYPCGTLNILGDGSNANAVLCSSLEKIMNKNFNSEILKLDQELFINHPTVGPLKVVVKKWEHSLVKPDAHFSTEPLSYYGLLSNETKINFSTGKKSSLVLVDELDSMKIERFYFNITQVVDVSEKVLSNSAFSPSYSAWKKGVQPLPIVMPFSELCKKIRAVFSDKYLLLDHKEKIRDGDWKYTVQLTKVKVSTSSDFVKEAEDDPEENNLKIFRFEGNHGITVTSGNNVITTTNFDNARLAKELTFEILDIDRDVTIEENEVAWLSVQQVAQEIKKLKPMMAANSKVVITVGGTKYLLKLVKQLGDPAKNEHESSNLKDVWKVNSRTSIKIFDNDLGVEIVDTPTAYELDHLKVKVSIPRSGFSGLFSFLSGGDADAEGDKTIIDEAELEQMFRESVCHTGIVHKNQTIQTLNGKGENIKFKLEDLKSEQCTKRSKAKSYYGEIYKLTPSSKIKFEGEKNGNVLISTKPDEITLENIDEKLLEFGIGGMKEEFKDIISRTILSRSTYADHIADIGQQPSRGLLLYGPPGTGKTLIARKLGEILRVTNERIKLLTGSKIWDKYVGESEKRVRQIFDDARKDQINANKKGEKPNLHLIIIDEIDAFLGARTSESKNWEKSVVTTFLSELDGISGDNPDPLNNVIVVGLTNHPDGLDEAVKRPGRLFPHIHIGIPDAKGREEIFNIHSKRIREKGYLADDVNIKKIVEMTVGKTGAFIEGLVTAATEYSSKRLWEKKVPSHKVKSDPVTKIYMADFEKAYKECIGSKRKKDKDITQFIPTSEINMKSIISDLARLNLGGLNEEAIKFLFDLHVSQQYKEFLYTMNQPFPRGVLLYGPSGSGKTRLAKSIRSLFSLDDQKFKYLKASELWPLRGAGLKEKIEEIIKPARNASGDLKGEAPLHVVVVDELDMMFLHKRETDTYDTSVMNQFLMELEPLFEENSEDVHNLLVIGIVHRNELGIPEGILRHGRLGKHVEVKLPNSEGRKEIFKIYLKQYIDKGKLDGKVNIDTLAEMTQNCTGAYIEGLVSLAVTHSMRRVMKNGVLPSEVKNAENCKLSVSDFENANNEMRTEQKWKEMYS